jgi:hypothetical protein
MRTKTSIKDTKASLGRKQAVATPALKQDKGPFKLSKFKKIKPRVFDDVKTSIE